LVYVIQQTKEKEKWYILKEISIFS
jgi:hypothetical protein